MLAAAEQDALRVRLAELEEALLQRDAQLASLAEAEREAEHQSAALAQQLQAGGWGRCFVPRSVQTH